MRIKQYTNIFGSPRYACSILPVCALLFFRGCGVSHRQGHNSPITVADGSMRVWTPEPSTVDSTTITVDSGKACRVREISGTTTVREFTLIGGKEWSLTSADGKAKIEEVNKAGKPTIIASANGLGMKDIPAPPTHPEYGPGKEFGDATVHFASAHLKYLDGTPGGGDLNCPDQNHMCQIDYAVGKFCP